MVTRTAFPSNASLSRVQSTREPGRSDVKEYANADSPESSIRYTPERMWQTTVPVVIVCEGRSKMGGKKIGHIGYLLKL